MKVLTQSTGVLGALASSARAWTLAHANAPMTASAAILRQ
jgi:hypothetical protein